MQRCLTGLRKYPLVRTVGFYSPAHGFEYSREETGKIILSIAENAPDLLILGLGAPKQELWVYTHQRQINVKLAICAGATIDFLAGEKNALPYGCEVFTLNGSIVCFQNPAGFWDVMHMTPFFPRIVWRQWVSDKRRNRL